LNLVRVGVTVIGGIAGVVVATVAEFEVGGVIVAGAAGTAGGIVVGTAIGNKFFSEVVDPIVTVTAAGAEGDRRLAAVLHNRAGVRPLWDADPYAIGVWRSATADEHRDPSARRPPYIERPIDEALLGSLAAAGAGGVVVAGQPKAGKSRTLFEALAASPTTRDRTLYALRPPDERVADVTTRPFDTLLDTPMDLDGPGSVLWIDDAHEHFAYGLTLDRLHELLERYRGVIVAMTVHAHQLQPAPHTSGPGELSSVDQALLDHLSELSRGHILATTLTAKEQADARHEYADLVP
jgi:hypothetical protein